MTCLAAIITEVIPNLMILMNQLLSGCLIVSQLYYIEFSFIARYLYESFWNLLVGECFVTLRLRVTLLLER